MKITLTPIRHDVRLEAHREGHRLILNGTSCDLSLGETCDWIVGTPELVEGEWIVTLLLPHGANAQAETLFPDVVEIAGDGSLPLPPYELPPEVDVGAADGTDNSQDADPA